MRNDVTRRERQILEILYEHGEATSQKIREELSDTLADATIRTMLRILEQKGIVVHRQEGKRFIYSPKEPHRGAASTALRRVLDVFFGGSIERAVALHLTDPEAQLDRDKLQALQQLIDSKSKRSKKNGRSVRNDRKVD